MSRQMQKRKTTWHRSEMLGCMTRHVAIGLCVLLSTGCSLIHATEIQYRDAGTGSGMDAGTDAGPYDSGTDAGTDAGTDTGMDAGSDFCAGNTCDTMDDACMNYSCNPDDGECIATPTALATSCETMTNACEAYTCDVDMEACVGGPTAAAEACEAMDTGCRDFSCQPSDGTCSDANINEGSACNECLSGAICISGTCAGGAMRPERFPCDLDGDACTADQCLSGICTTGNPLEGALEFVGVDLDGDLDVDRIRIGNVNPGGVFNFSMRGINLCTTDSSGTTCQLISAFINTFFDDNRAELEREAGEVALAADNRGTHICDYIRWDDDPPIDAGERAFYTMAANAGPSWSADADVVDNTGLADNMTFNRIDPASAPTSWIVGPMPVP